MVVQAGREATRNARDKYHSGTTAYHNLCLRHVREDLEIGSRELTAEAARKALDPGQFHKWTNEDAVPFGAPFWTMGSNPAGHIVLAGGRFRATGRRIFWTTDQFGDGAITPVTVDFFRDQWGHKILGWGTRLNNVAIPFLAEFEKRRRQR